MAKHSKDLPHSSSIQRCEYNDETKDMHVTFASGGKHCFKDVEKDVYDGLAAAQSPGKYFHQHLRKNYKSEKVD